MYPSYANFYFIHSLILLTCIVSSYFLSAQQGIYLFQRILFSNQKWVQIKAEISVRHLPLRNEARENSKFEIYVSKIPTKYILYINSTNFWLSCSPLPHWCSRSHCKRQSNWVIPSLVYFRLKHCALHSIDTEV